MMPNEETMDKFVLETKKRVDRICRHCPERKGKIMCNLLNRPLGAAAISADCPFEDLTGNESIDVIQDVIGDWKIAKVIGSFNERQ